MIACGLATHYSHSKVKLPQIEEQLGNLLTDDPSIIETSLERYGDLVYPDKTSVLHRIETVDKCFSHGTVEEIFDALVKIREGRFQTLDQCLVREYRMSLQATSKQFSGDFCKGVRARVMDKDFAPKWEPPSLEDVSEDMVDRYFCRLSEFEPELELPTKQREAFT
ncbi:Enoyl-CoA hydratase/isomerase domain [Dillenia turbinata]|uniref:3-hydroxyisobutyryl-CoA hydrolase n=1 Tax=Dillenia turbinata TaxID=194707 RepID=A0AAN8UWB9_9MAGN